MTKFSYLCFVKSEKNIPPEWTAEVLKKWNTEHHQVCHEMGFTLLLWGESYGLVEEGVMVYESDKDLEAFNNFLSALKKIEPRWMAYVRTASVVNVPKNLGVDEEFLRF